MDSPELFIAFAALMLVAALLGVAIDWFGKPMKHRRFVPKVYRFPDERQPRDSKVRKTEWSDASMVLPVVESSDAPVLRYPDHATAGSVAAAASALGAGRDIGPPTAQVPVVRLDGVPNSDAPIDPALDDPALDDPALDDMDSAATETPGLVTLEDLNGTTQPDTTQPDTSDAETPNQTPGLVTLEDLNGTTQPDTRDADSASDPTNQSSGKRKQGWLPGQYVFNLTPDGREPSATTVRTRYWKNVAATPGASVFGATNVDRMSDGKAPRRRNHRTGKDEIMRLPGVSHNDTGGNTPVPEWPANEVDPFA